MGRTKESSMLIDKKLAAKRDGGPAARGIDQTSGGRLHQKNKLWGRSVLLVGGKSS